MNWPSEAMPVASDHLKLVGMAPGVLASHDDQGTRLSLLGMPVIGQAVSVLLSKAFHSGWDVGRKQGFLVISYF